MSNPTSALTGPQRPTPAPSASVADAPDVVFVLRHHLWLIVVGTIVVTMLGGVSYLLFRQFMPRYSVFAQFQVMPPYQADDTRMGMSPTANQNYQPAPTIEELTRFMQRQKFFVLGDRVLDKVLESDAFQKDYNDPTQQSRWLRNNLVSPKVALKKDIEFVAYTNSDLFAVGMTGPDPKELTREVRAVADTYYEELRNNEATEDSRKTDELRAAKSRLDTDIKQAEAALESYRNLHNIQAITQGYTVQANLLGELNTEYMKAESMVTGAKAQEAIMQQQVQNGTLQLTAEMELFVQNNDNLKYLKQTMHGLQQERAADLLQFDEKHTIIKNLDARINECQGQIQRTEAELRSMARDRMLENSHQNVAVSEAQADDLKTQRDRQETALKDMEKWLVDYASMKQLLDDRKELQKNITQQLTLSQLQTRQDASRVKRFADPVEPDPSDISFPRRAYFAVGSPLLGILLSFGLAYLLEMTNTRVRTPRDISKTLQLPLLGFVPDLQDDDVPAGELASCIRTAPGSMMAESYRQIRGRLAAQINGQPVNTLLIASVSPGGGATTFACNLANGIAINGVRVLLVDANFYRPGLRQSYPALPQKGLSNIIAGTAQIDETLIASELPNLSIMSAGSVPAAAASELLESKAFRELISQLRSRYDVVIFDGAPLNLVGDSISIASKVDGVIAVVRAGMVSRGTVGRVRDQLRQTRANLIGLVLNAAQAKGSGYFRENYRTFYQYAGNATANNATPQTVALHSRAKDKAGAPH